MSQLPNNRRRRFRFGLRTFLLLMVLVALFFAWIGRHLHRSRIQRPIVAQVQQAGGSVYYQHESHSHPLRSSASPHGSALIRSLFGDDIFATVNTVFLCNPETTDKDVAQLDQLFDLRCLQLEGKGVTDKCVVDLLQIKKLSGLILSNTSISPEGLSRLSEHKRLRAVTLEGSGIGDEHVRQLKRISNLQHLQLVSTNITDNGMSSIRSNDALQLLGIHDAPRITDQGIAALRDLRNIASITISDAVVSNRSIAALQTALPDCDVRMLTAR